MSTYFTRSFSSFSGADIKAVFADIEIGTLQAISYAVHREKAPIYVMGDPNPRAFSRGKRGIAGSLIFVMFDDHALLGEFQKHNPSIMKFVKDKDELSPQIARDDAALPEAVTAGDDLVTAWEENWEVAQAFYADQIPPFDITVAAVNETAAAAVLRIWGVEILNEGYGISTDDMSSETQMTYVARALTRWTRASAGASAEDLAMAGASQLPFSAKRIAGGTEIQGS